PADAARAAHRGDQGAGLPDARLHLRRGRHRRGIHDGARNDHAARQGPRREAAGRTRGHDHHRAAVPGEQGEPNREDRGALQGQEEREHLDQVIRLIRQAESPDAAKDALMARLDLSQIQAKAILEMRHQRLTQLERHKVVDEHEQTLGLIEELKGILASDTKLMGIIRKELLELKEEYGDVRRTEILTETAELTIEDLLADEEMVVTITRSGYIKRTHVESYRSQRRGGKGV